MNRVLILYIVVSFRLVVFLLPSTSTSFSLHPIFVKAHLDKCFMLPTRGKQKPKRGGQRRSLPQPSAPSSESPGLIQIFFAGYAPRFQYNPIASSSLEFYRLCDEFGWDKEHPERIRAHQKFKDALVLQFNETYGINVNSLESWHNLCHVVRIDPIPEDLDTCREAVRRKFVNLVDLVDRANTGVEVTLFETERQLSQYTLSTGKIFPGEHAYAGGVLRYLLRHILHPRDDHSSASRRRRGAKVRR
ncbi:hypothetical protein JVU11DRAFT_8259 [Chiua virens]|nr:hypothetical protein JVU11DRAFT_8259 [Chiua virens]